MPLELQSLPFDPASPRAALAQLPQSSAVFALYGAEAHAEPYIGRTPNLRARLQRLLQPSEKHPRRLQLAGRVRRIEWRLTGSEFESLLLQFDLLEKVYGAKCLERMHLRAPAFIRFFGGNPYPRVAVTNRPGLREAEWAYGPYPSRAAAERAAEETLKLFLLRRCTDDLSPDPSHPGCVYSEMKMCLAPCYMGCTGERYAEEAAAVEQFLSTRGESRLVPLRALRERASENLEFEAAATHHAQIQRVESVRSLSSELVRPLSRLRAVILQAAANLGEVAVFLYEDGRLRGPASFSTLGMRIQNEQSGSTSLFAQPMALEPIPEAASEGTRHQGSENQGTGNREQGTEGREQESEIDSDSAESVVTGRDFSRAASPSPDAEHLSPETPAVKPIPRTQLESRLEALLAELSAPASHPSSTVRQAHLALLKRWYYRPEARRAGEIFFPDEENRWPLRSILRGIGRVAAGMWKSSGSAA